MSVGVEVNHVIDGGAHCGIGISTLVDIQLGRSFSWRQDWSSIF